MTNIFANWSRWAKVALVLGILASLFVLQLLFDSTSEVLVLYGIPLLLTFFFRRSKAPYFYTFLISLLIFAGWIIKSPANGQSNWPFVLCLLALLWLIAFAIHQLKKDNIRIAAQKQRYEKLSEDLSAKLQIKIDEKIKQHESENNSLKLAIRSGGVGIWDWDIKNNFLLWDDQMFFLYGINRSNFQLNYHSWESCVHPADRMNFSTAFQNALTGNKTMNTEFRVVWPDQSLRYIKILGFVERDDDKNALRFVGTNWDITEEKKAEVALVEYKDQLEQIVQRRTEVLNELNSSLQHSESLLNLMSDIGNIGGWELDLVNKKIMWTQQVFKIHEIDGDEIPPLEECINFYAPEARGVIQGAMINCEEKEESFELELPFVTAKDNRIWVRSKGRPVVQNGKVVKIAGIFQDISVEKQLRDSLIVINEDLDRKVDEKMVNLDRVLKELEIFTYTVSHDLRSPLRAIEGFSKALLDSYKGILDEDGERWLQYIMSNTEKMGNLITDILSFSRVGRSPVQHVTIDMNKMIEEKFDELKTKYVGKIVKLNVEKLPKANGDRALIAQLLANLIGNALKFSSKNEEIRIEIKGKIENDFVVYSIQDYGAGFDPKYIDKLFVVFQRLHGGDEFDGSGVGLAIVDRIIQKHKGWIKAESYVGEGATFTFGLPI